MQRLSPCRGSHETFPEAAPHFEQDDDGYLDGADGFRLCTSREFQHGVGRQRNPNIEANDDESEFDHDDLRLLENIDPDLAARLLQRLQYLEMETREYEHHALQLESIADESVDDSSTRNADDSHPVSDADLLANEDSNRSRRRTLKPFALTIVFTCLFQFLIAGNKGDLLPCSSSWKPNEINFTEVFGQSRPVAKPDHSFVYDILQQSSCPDVFEHMVEEVSEAEGILERDILGYQQMLSSMVDWISVMERFELNHSRTGNSGSKVPSGHLGAEFFDEARAVVINVTSVLGSKLLGEYRIAAGLRKVLRQEQRIFLRRVETPNSYNNATAVA